MDTAGSSSGGPGWGGQWGGRGSSLYLGHSRLCYGGFGSLGGAVSQCRARLTIRCDGTQRRHGAEHHLFT